MKTYTDKTHFAFLLEIKVPESRGSKESEEGDARHETQQCKRTEGHNQTNLCLH